jgi:hypothetical protein
MRWTTVVAILAGCSEYAFQGKEAVVDEPDPVIVVDPPAIDFGVVSQNVVVEQPFTVTNAGDAPLVLGEIHIEGDDAFRLTTAVSGVELAPGETLGDSVLFEPQGAERFGRVQIPSDDPVNPLVGIDLHGAPGTPGLAVDPALVDLGYVEVGADATATFEVTNVGEWRAEITAAVLAGATSTTGAPAFAVEFTPFALMPGDSKPVTVRFTPLAPVPYSDQLVITMEGVGDAAVEVIGTGIAAPMANCDAIPAVPLLTLDEVTWIGSGSTDPAGRPLTSTWTLVGAPYGSVAVMPGSAGPDLAGFIPDLPGTYVAELTVTNDVGLSATCQAAVDAFDAKPTAACSVSPNPVDAIQGTAAWSGTGSADPLGGTLDYTWTLVAQPLGSAVVMPSGPAANPTRGGFVADMVGTYTGQLVVTNSVGLSSEPCLVDLEAEPSGDLWIELYWSHNNDDMDLHVVRSTGSLRTGQDCYFNNCLSGLAWGPAGPDGDPSLDLDDIVGRGPENVNITAPEDVVYHVWVHDFPGHTWNGNNLVTVNVYLSGFLAWTDTLTISGDGTDTWFADIDWATQTVTP